MKSSKRRNFVVICGIFSVIILCIICFRMDDFFKRRLLELHNTSEAQLVSLLKKYQPEVDGKLVDYFEEEDKLALIVRKGECINQYEVNDNNTTLALRRGVCPSFSFLIK